MGRGDHELGEGVVCVMHLYDCKTRASKKRTEGGASGGGEGGGGGWCTSVTPRCNG